MDGSQADREFSEVRIVRNGCAVAAGFRFGSGHMAEGVGRRTTKELLRSLQIAAGELEETRYFLILSRDLRYIAAPRFDEGRVLCDSLGQLINALGRSLKRRLN